MKKWLIRIVILTVVGLMILQMLALPSFAAETNDGAQLFESNCAGCHLKGGNIVRRGKTLKQRALTKNGFTTVEAIADLVTHGKGNMSAYGEQLTPAEIQAVSQYVFDQAQRNWQP